MDRIFDRSPFHVKCMGYFHLNSKRTLRATKISKFSFAFRQYIQYAIPNKSSKFAFYILTISPYGHVFIQKQEVRSVIRRPVSFDRCRHDVFLIRIRRVAFPVFRIQRHSEYRVIPLEANAIEPIPRWYRELFEPDRRFGGPDIVPGFESPSRKIRHVPQKPGIQVRSDEKRTAVRW